MNEFSSNITLVNVYDAPNEFMALSIESLLEQNHIKVILKSYQIPLYDSIGTLMKGKWGEVLVEDKDEKKARELIKGFLTDR